MNTQSETETAQDFEALYLAYKAKYEAVMRLLGFVKAELADILEESRHE